MFILTLARITGGLTLHHCKIEVVDVTVSPLSIKIFIVSAAAQWVQGGAYNMVLA